MDDSSDEVPCYCGDHCPQNPGLRKTSKSQKTQLQKIILNVSVVIPQKAKIFISHLFTLQTITEHLLSARLRAGHLASRGDDSQGPCQCDRTSHERLADNDPVNKAKNYKS